MRTLLESAARRAVAYLDGIEARPVAPAPGAIAALQALDEPLPAGSTAPEAVLDLLDRLGSPATMAMAGPRFATSANRAWRR